MPRIPNQRAEVTLTIMQNDLELLPGSPQPHHTGFFLVLIHLCFKFQDPYGPNSFLYTRNSPRPKGRAWTVLAGIVAECRGELEVLVADLSRVSPSAEFL